MQFTKLSITALFTILAATAMAAPAPDSSAPDSVAAREAAPEPEAYDAPVGLEKRGFGCPGNEKKCHNHCKGIKGYKGGYCDGPYIPFVGRPRCKCY
ncbi:hypothetical protein SAPIO_CDS1668 [Scedosporium apiospermum]|uniref:Invertebrate defensins family profile domain-containing protein n=1 Tax=Pseudallescheria apiosperma TaxID=563466 RepID=A0A084GET2_PSEDA|nr:uncharacterized protein SAPIO_CDS1668 [Scedosporium apiospermum]KEZ45844.1 hypothetical protein SAPIO_CDS1668 [Scedosporium apiospermum]